jgi:hypothetical protein
MVAVSASNINVQEFRTAVIYQVLFRASNINVHEFRIATFFTTAIAATRNVL